MWNLKEFVRWAGRLPTNGWAALTNHHQWSRAHWEMLFSPHRNRPAQESCGTRRAMDPPARSLPGWGLTIAGAGYGSTNSSRAARVESLAKLKGRAWHRLRHHHHRALPTLLQGDDLAQLLQFHWFCVCFFVRFVVETPRVRCDYMRGRFLQTECQKKRLSTSASTTHHRSRREALLLCQRQCHYYFYSQCFYDCCQGVRRSMRSWRLYLVVWRRSFYPVCWPSLQEQVVRERRWGILMTPGGETIFAERGGRNVRGSLERNVLPLEISFPRLRPMGHRRRKANERYLQRTLTGHNLIWTKNTRPQYWKPRNMIVIKKFSNPVKKSRFH